MYQERNYRKLHTPDLHSFQIKYEACDLWVAIDSQSYTPALVTDSQTFIENKWHELYAYIGIDNLFANTLSAYEPSLCAPAIAIHMAQVAKLANVGPMAAVAGCFSQELGIYLTEKFHLQNIIIENGGDIWLCSNQQRTIALYAGNSPLSGKIGLSIQPTAALGICTSSGTVGHSLSFGVADAVTVVAKDAALADAFATAIANTIQTIQDIDLALSNLPQDVIGCIIILGKHIGVKGNLQLISII